MMLPFFILAFWATYALNGLYGTRQQALVTARGCTWLYAQRACRGPMPDYCPDMPNASRSGTPFIENTGFGSIVEQVFDIVENLPLLRPITRTMLPSHVTGRAENLVEVRSNFGGGARRVHGEFYAMCNTERRTEDEVAEAIFCDFVLNIIPGCEDREFR